MSTVASLSAVSSFLDAFLKLREVADYPNAINGLQLENSGSITKIGAAVDVGGYTIKEAANRGIDFLLAHHGMFWSGLQPMTGGHYRAWKTAFESGLAIYSAHLPLDVHPQIGNNAVLCDALGFHDTVPFFDHKGTKIGLRTSFSGSRSELIGRLEKAVDGAVRICPGGSEQLREVGVITGGAGAELRAVVREGIDTFITGEGPHWTYALAEELGVNLLYAGHYATETFGVKALAARLGEEFGLPWEFIDHPTGL